MTDRFQTPKAPLRVGPRPVSTAAPSVPATPGGLIRSNLLAPGAAADAQATDAAPFGPPAPDTADRAARLDRTDAQLATIAAAIASTPGQTDPVPETPVATDPAPEVAAPSEAEVPDPAWRDEVSYTLNPGEGIEVELAMEEGQTARFGRTANGSVVNFDQHGDGGFPAELSGHESGVPVPGGGHHQHRRRGIRRERAADGNIDKQHAQRRIFKSLGHLGAEDLRREHQGRAVTEKAGDLTTAFTGNHDWFWRNRTDAPVTITLRTGEDNAALKAP